MIEGPCGFLSRQSRTERYAAGCSRPISDTRQGGGGERRRPVEAAWRRLGCSCRASWLRCSGWIAWLGGRARGGAGGKAEALEAAALGAARLEQELLWSQVTRSSVNVRNDASCAEAAASAASAAKRSSTCLAPGRFALQSHFCTADARNNHDEAACFMQCHCEQSRIRAQPA